MKMFAVLLLGLAGAFAAAQESEAELVSAREAYDTARAKLDEAAQEFAELHREMPSFNFTFSDTDRPFLGVLIRSGDEAGIRLAGVTPGGGAAAAGVKAGDLIVRIDGADLTGTRKPLKVLHDALDDVEPGDTVKVVIHRDGEPMTVDLVTQAHNAGHMIKILQDGDWGGDFDFDFDFSGLEDLGERLSYMGGGARAAAFGGLKLIDVDATLGEYFGVDEGVLVIQAEDAAEGSLLAGDIVQKIGDTEVQSARDAYVALAEIEDEAKVVVRRQNKRKVVKVAANENVSVHKVIRYRKHGNDD